MTLEVEQKYTVGALPPIRARLDAQGARWLPPSHQSDTYFAHPQRDFGTTDEALRLRRTEDGLALTYKGPRTGQGLKTRREIELSLSADTADGLTQILEVLGFRPVAEVRKHRVEAEIIWHREQAHVALDEVEHLGAFVEIEVIVTDGPTDAAARVVSSLAEFLGLSRVEPRTYLEMVLQTLAGQGATAKS